MAVLVMFLLISSLFSGSDATWCVCRNDKSSTDQQKALDYACGAGADCSAIQQSGACYEPNTVLAHCSYAANSYFQKQNQVQTSCDFAGTATVTPTDPSYSGCTYPANVSAAGTGTASTPITPASPTTGTPTTTTTGTPTTTTGILGLGPSSTTGISTDGTGGAELLKTPVDLLSLAAVLSGLVLLGGWR